MTHIPFKRNWLEEAYDIASGKLKVSPKKEHLVACVKAIDELANNLNKIRGLFKKISDAANEARIKKGLPPLSESPE